jgi:hypothetical protein
MLQYVDDAVYSAQNVDQQDGGLTGMAGSLAWNFAKFELSQQTLNMLSKSHKTGMYVPFTRGGKGKIARAGMRMGWWGTEGRTFTKGMGAAGKYYKSVFTYAPARRAAAAALGTKAANIAGTKFLIARAAGLANPLVQAAFWGQLAWGMTGGLYNTLSSQVQKYRGLEMGGYFPETQGATTSRQRAVQAITSSNMQARSAIGNEAMLFHR